MKKNLVFIATSLDGLIADENGNIDWLNEIPNPDQDDMGFENFMSGIDALIMGRTTFETVCSFDIEWPYSKPVFVLSHRLKEIPIKFQDQAKLVKGNLNEVLSNIHELGYHRLYIDGGKTIQSFLNQDLIDEMIITIIPTLLGKGIALFNDLDKKLKFECLNSQLFLGKVVQNHFVRSRS